MASPDAWLSEILGGSAPTTSGVSVSAASALRVPAVSAAVQIISEAVASLDLKVVAIAEDGCETDDPQNDILTLLRDQPCEWLSGFELIRSLVADALCNDAGGLAWVNRPSGRPVEIIKYMPGAIGVTFDTLTGEPSYTLNGRPLASTDVIHLRPPLGRAPLTLAREAIGLALVLEQHGAALFGRGARPSGALKFPSGMGEESLKKAQAAWRLTHEGGNSAGRTAILHDGAEFVPFQLTSTDAQFLENRRFQIEEIARAFNIPAPMIGDLSRATWSNTEAKGREFLSYTLEPWLRALEGALRRALWLPEERPRFAVRFDRDDLTRADLTTRATAINSLIASRVLNPNEGRQWLGMQPRVGGDEFLNPNISASVPPATDKDPANGA